MKNKKSVKKTIKKTSQTKKIENKKKTTKKNLPEKKSKTDEIRDDKKPVKNKEEAKVSKKSKKIEEKIDTFFKEHKREMEIVSKIDHLVQEINDRGEITLDEIEKKYGWDEESMNDILNSLEKKLWCKVKFPLNIMDKPKAIKRKPFKIKKVETPKYAEEHVEMYQFESYGWTVPIFITYSEATGYLYNVHFPLIQEPTRDFLFHIRDKLSRIIPNLSDKEMTTEKIGLIRRKIMEDATTMLKQYFDEKQIDMFSCIVMSDIVGLGIMVEGIMDDESIEEIAINKANTPISVYHKKYGWMQTNQIIHHEEEVFSLASNIARKAGKQITILSPLLDARLEQGERVNATLYPVSTHGNSITIRKFSKEPWTIIDFIGSTIDINIAALLWQAFHYEMTVLVVGGTASGKTTMMNSLLPFIPSNQRIVTIEDTREINLSKHHWNWVPLLTRSPNVEDIGGITMLDLMVNSLRMRPDRIIVGEIRKAQEAEVLFEAMHTGHSVYATLHADTAEQTLRRLANPPFSIPATELEVLNLIVVQYRDRRRNLRRISELCEVNVGARGELVATPLWRWVPMTDKFEMVNLPVKYLQELNLHTGITEKEFRQDIDERIMVLEWMKKNNVRDVDNVATVIKAFYTNRESLMAKIKKNVAVKEVLEMV
ncbi:type II/IV secretion system ATPase subunit [Candidatus Micrarchaeota archaeon]|nr:type II/IV secretion system ATPase subunit [Candidatus Micrarchaeota archaeon]